jgi:spoIIIJ-associated protein
MEWVETTGKTIEEAKEAALDELGVDEQDAEFEVLEEPKLGLFGRVRAEGRVRARVRPTTPRAKEDRRDRRRRTRGATGAAGDDAADTTTTTATGGERSTRGDGNGAAAPADEPGGVGGQAPAATAGAGDAGDDGGGGGGGGGPSRSGRSRRRRGGGGAGGAGGRSGGEGADDSGALSRSATSNSATSTSATSNPAANTSAGGRAARTSQDSSRATARDQRPRRRSTEHDDDGHERIGAEGGTLMDVALVEQGKIAEQFLEGLLTSFGLSADIDVQESEEDERVDIKIDGDGLGLLIGPKGATLLAIQDLTRTAVQYKTSARNGRLYVDVSRYREKRAVALSAFARKIADDVLSTGRPVALEPMSAADRKLVHDTITDIDGVETRSDGEDDRRHVVVFPSGH